MPQGGNYSFGSATVSSWRSPAERLADAKAAKAWADGERARISRLSDQDVVKIMARVIRDTAQRRGEVQRLDFRQAGVPDARIDDNFDRAMARARRLDAAVDGMGVQP